MYIYIYIYDSLSHTHMYKHTHTHTDIGVGDRGAERRRGCLLALRRAAAAGTRNPEPETRNPKPGTLKLETRNPKPKTLQQKISMLHHKPSSPHQGWELKSLLIS